MTRIEGHLKIEATVDDKRVVEVKCGRTLYRGFEQILVGCNPLDAVQITQRFCGVCPIPHAIASAQALEDAFGIQPPPNGRTIRNIMQGANYIQSHILHFYHLASLDFFRGPDVPPFVPRYEADYRVPKSVHESLLNHYIQAYQIRLKAHELCAIWAGKMPHAASIVPGGVSITPRLDNVTTSIWRLKELTEFIDNAYLPDVLTVAEIYRDYFQIGAGCRNLLSFGLFDLDGEPDVMRRRRFFPMARMTGGDRPGDSHRLAARRRPSQSGRCSMQHIASELELRRYDRRRVGQEADNDVAAREQAVDGQARKCDAARRT